MFTDYANDQMQRAEERYRLDASRREERTHHLNQLQNKNAFDLARVDEEQRIRVRARVLGLDDDLLRMEKSEVILERILATRDLLPGDFLRVGARVSTMVGRIHVRDGNRRSRGFGTGFMISNQLMMTNNHVLSRASDCAHSVIEFDFVHGLLDSIQRSSFFALDPSAFFITNPTLDYTIVALAPSYDQQQAQKRGWLALIPESGKLLVGERVNIVQHPRGGPQEVGLRQNRLESVDGDFLIYTTDTEPGSSGSPVCNDQWQLAALHHAGVPERNSQGEIIGWVANEGVRISSIVRDVRERLQSRPRPAAEMFEVAFMGVLPAPEAPTADAGLSAGAALEIPLRLSIQLGSGPHLIASTPPVSAALLPVSQPELSAPADKRPAAPPDGLPVFSNPQLECIVARIKPGTNVKTVWRKYAEQWDAVPIDQKRRPLSFDLVPKSANISVADAWDIVHRLRADRNILQAEPSWEIAMVTGEEREEDAREGLFDDKADRAAKKKTWAPELIEVENAWKLPTDRGKSRGEGIRVAHPDSGYTRHPELWERADAIDIASGKDFVDDDKDALDKDGFHGTGTASVLMSSANGDIMGVAPVCTLVPMRVAQQGLLPSPVLVGAGTRHLRDAIYRAIDQDCHVISISLGWFGNAELHAAVKAAWEADLIIVAAAGNYTGPLIVWPARYPECICIAGCDADRAAWDGSARGSRVDFTAPAEDVWKAGFKDGKEKVVQSSGTSFATAMTAGVAALWLAFHSRGNLLRKYRRHGVHLAEVFRAVLKRSSGNSPRSWFGGFGGIINAKQALQASLPEPSELRRSFGHEAFTVGSEDTDRMAGPSLVSALEIMGGDYADGRSYLAEALNVGEDALDRIADGCGDELAFHAVLNQAAARRSELEGIGTQYLDKEVMSKHLLKRF